MTYRVFHLDASIGKEQTDREATTKPYLLEFRRVSCVEDARKLMQDFVAPELRGIAAQIQGIHEQIAASDKLSSERHLALLERMEGMRREISPQIELALANRKLQEIQARQMGDTPQ